METPNSRLDSFYGRNYPRTSGTVRGPMSPTVLQDQYSRYYFVDVVTYETD